jgi:hypothetical protein
MPAPSYALVLHPRIERPFRAIFAACAAWVGALLVVHGTEGAEHVLALVLMTLCALIALFLIAFQAGLLLGVGALVLTREGFDARVVVFSRFVRWDDVHELVADGPSVIYAFDCNGYIDADRFGMSGEALAALLNEWREHRGPRP